MRIVGATSAFSALLVFAACGSTDADEDVAINTSHQSLETPPIQGARAPSSLMTARVVDERVSALKQTERFIQLQEVLKKDYSVMLDVSGAEGRTYPEGDVLLIPVIEAEGDSDAGHAVISQTTWAIGINRADAPLEGYQVESDATGTITLKSILPEVAEDAHEHELGAGGGFQTYSSWSCQYVSNIGFDISCWELPGNPLALYYEQTNRIGYGDPSMPQWWACYYGYIHTCPQYEYGYYSPIVIPICGFAPNHPTG